MSAGLSAAAQQQFDSEVKHAFQSQGVLRGTTTIRNDVVGDIYKSQEIKQIVNNLRKNKVKESYSHMKAYRPWGNYKTMLKGDRWQVKIITVNPGEAISLQMHHHRAEHWIVVKGTAQIELDGEKTLLS